MGKLFTHKQVKGRHLYTATYMNMTSSSLQCKVEINELIMLLINLP